MLQKEVTYDSELENVKSCGVDEFKTKFKNRKTHDDLVHLAHID